MKPKPRTRSIQTEIPRSLMKRKKIYIYKQTQTRSFRIITIRLHPPARHLDSLGPLPIHLAAVRGRDLGREDGAIRAVHVLELAEVLPDIDREARGDRGPERCGFVHRGPLDGDLDHVCLGLDHPSVSLVLVVWLEGRQRTCMQISELLIPPSTARSLSLWPLSFSMASRIALVW